MRIETLLTYPTIFLVSVTCVLILVPLISTLALKIGAVDMPGPRRLHRQPIPRIGGVAVFVGFHVACAVMFSVTHVHAGMLDFHWWLYYLVISTFLLLVGLADDIFGMQPLHKLLYQIVAAALMYSLGVRVANLLGIELPVALDLGITVLWFLAITNAFNLIDGMDGLAAGLASIASIGIMGSFLYRGLYDDALMMIGFLGATLAFLRYNFNPACIFLGDTGSMFLGFTLAAVSLSTGSKGTMMASIGVPLLAVGIPVFDTMLAVWRRSVRKAFPGATGQSTGGVMHFDMEHLHHRLIRTGLTQRRVAVMLYLANGALVAAGLLSLLFKAQAAGIFVFAFVVGAYVVVKHVAHVELWDSGVAILEGFKRPVHGTRAVLLYPIVDGLLMAAALSGSIAICRLSMQSATLNDVVLTWFYSLPVWCGVPFVVLFAARTYSRVWSRARISEFVLLALTLITGSLFGWSVAVLIDAQGTKLMAVEAVLYCSLSVAFLVGIRGLPRLVRDLMLFSADRPKSDCEAQRCVVVYGVGERGLLYLRNRDLQGANQCSLEKVVGLIDDDRNLRRRLVHGYRVLGGLRDLARLLSRVSVDEIILCAPLTMKRRARLLKLAKRYEVAVLEWTPVLQNLYQPIKELPPIRIPPEPALAAVQAAVNG